MEYSYISPSSGIDALCPHPLPCECGSGSNLRGEGHSDWCQLRGESKYEPRDSNDPGPVAELALKKWFYVHSQELLGTNKGRMVDTNKSFISIYADLFNEVMDAPFKLSDGRGPPIWVMLEPSPYSDIGGFKYLVRHPIKSDRKTHTIPVTFHDGND